MKRKNLFSSFLFFIILAGTLNVNAQLSLVSPADNATGVQLNPTLTWSGGTGPYTVGVFSDAGMTTLVEGIVVPAGTYSTTTSLITNNNTQYWWKVTDITPSMAGPFTFTTIIETPTLNLPVNNSTAVSVLPTLTWNTVTGATFYDLEIATDAGFTTGVQSFSGILSNSYTFTTALSHNTNYYWHVRASDGTNSTVYSGYWMFTTLLETPVLVSPANNAINTSINPTLTWNPVSGATYYTLDLATDAGFTNIIFAVSSITSTFYDVTLNLANLTNYYWRVRAFNPTNNSNFSSGFKFTTIRAVQPFLGWPLGGAQIYTPTVYFSWYLNESGLGITYDFLFSTSPTMVGAVIVPNLGTTYYSMGGFIPGTTYYWQVRSKIGSVISKYSTIESFISYGTTTTPIPSWPTGGATVYINPPTLYWYLNTANQGLTFEIEWNSTGVFTGTPTVGYTGITNLYKELTTLPAGTYYWKVRSYNGTSYSAWSIAESFVIQGVSTPLQPILAWPVGGAIVYSGSTQLSWYLNGSTVGLTFDIEINTTGTFTGIPTFTGISYNYYNYTGLVNGTTYYWRVRSYDGTTYSSWSTSESFTAYGSSTDITPICSWPVGGASVYSTTVDLYWYLNSYFSGMTFDIEYNTTGTFTGTPTVSGITNTYHQLTGLVTGTTYYWKVRSHNGPTISNWSAGESFTVVSTTGSLTPICSWPVGGATVYTSSQNLLWYLNGSSAGLTYDLEYNTTGTFTGTPTVAGITNLYYEITGLTNGTYYWRVRSYNGTTYSTWSSGESFVVLLPTGPMRPVTGSPINNVITPTNNPMLSWYLPAGSSTLNYEVQYSTNPNMSDAVLYSTNSTRLQANGLNSGTKYYWRVRSKSTNGQFSGYSNVASFIPSSPTGVTEKVIPNEYALIQNYPNPFNPSTMIKFNIPVDSRVQLIIYNSLGQIVTKLVDENRAAGSYEVNFDASGLSSGLYFYKLIANNFVSVKKMILVK